MEIKKVTSNKPISIPRKCFQSRPGQQHSNVLAQLRTEPYGFALAEYRWRQHIGLVLRVFEVQGLGGLHEVGLRTGIARPTPEFG